MHPTPTKSAYGSSQNGINGKGGAFERPSAGTPSLWSKAAAMGGEPAPDFFAWTMGFPAGWTMPADPPSGTQLCLL